MQGVHHGYTIIPAATREPWNKGKLIGQKAPFKPKEIWAIRTRLETDHNTRDLALFNLGIDVMRTETKGATGKVFQSCGVALPPTLRAA